MGTEWLGSALRSRGILSGRPASSRYAISQRDCDFVPNAWQNHRHHVNEYLKAHTCEQLNPFQLMFGAVLRKLDFNIVDSNSPVLPCE